MVVGPPPYLLFISARLLDANGDEEGASPAGGWWHFSLQRLDKPEHLEAEEVEELNNLDRLSLLAVVRGLEALDQPATVTLVTASRYVLRGMRYGLSSWRERNYMWERFGELIPIRNADLWQRIDHALQYHVVTCRGLPAGMVDGSPRRRYRRSHSTGAPPPSAVPRAFDRIDSVPVRTARSSACPRPHFSRRRSPSSPPLLRQDGRITPPVRAASGTTALVPS
ncbi:MAG: ribonuclease HI [Pirellulaceae bacterium]|nr:MAG: ribonuclease HI [Pirellulaceae bacterium]